MLSLKAPRDFIQVTLEHETWISWFSNLLFKRVNVLRRLRKGEGLGDPGLGDVGRGEQEEGEEADV
jgi:hypothetical protein